MLVRWGVVVVWFGLVRFGGGFWLFCGWLGWWLRASVFCVGLLFVVVAADLVCVCYSMVYSCVLRGAALWGFGVGLVLGLDGGEFAVGLVYGVWLIFHGLAGFGLFGCWLLDLCDLGVGCCGLGFNVHCDC